MAIEQVELHDDWLRVTFTNERARTSDFHYRWLRHNSDVDRHPATRERILCSSEIPDGIRPLSVSHASDAVVLRWPGHDEESRYDAAFLLAHGYAHDRATPTIPSDVTSLLVGTGPELAARVLKTLRAHGAAVVRGAGTDTESLIDDFAAQGLVPVETHFGRIEDLRTDNTTNKNTDQLGYTNAAIQLHTDQPFIERPPKLQMLHCMTAAPDGGDNFLVDALAASRALRHIDRDAWTRLTTIPVHFHRRQKAFESLQVRPILAGDGDDFQVRYSYFTLAPYQRPFEEMESWYRAHDRFARLVRDERHQYKVRLEAGDFLIYDNHRMIHARTGFSGGRWLRGVYFDPA